MLLEFYFQRYYKSAGESAKETSVAFLCQHNLVGMYDQLNWGHALVR